MKHKYPTTNMLTLGDKILFYRQIRSSLWGREREFAERILEVHGIKTPKPDTNT